MKVRIAATTDKGKVRPNNEDAYIFCPDLGNQEWDRNDIPFYITLSDFGTIMVVADGMGGENAGEVASGIAVMTVKKVFTRKAVEQAVLTGRIEELMKKYVETANEAINTKANQDPSTYGMGTTIVACWIVNEIAHVAWCGDSRCYVYNPLYGLQTLTKDHSYVQELIDSGKITEKEAFTHPDSNVITRGLGDIDVITTPDMIDRRLEAGDTLILCSDGLCGYCPNQSLEGVLSRNYTDVKRCTESLLNLAMDKGGYDNICIIVASVIADNETKPHSQTFIMKLKEFCKRFLSN